jgi:DNA-binding LacI/PurR family transcriptional regulator
MRFAIPDTIKIHWKTLSSPDEEGCHHSRRRPAAGVSVATVSTYMNGTQRFTPAVEARLKEEVEQLGYRSNPLARSMITGRTRTIGLAILDIRNPHFTNIVKGANRVALQHDYTLLLVDTEESQEREKTPIESLAQRVDGVIISSRMPDDSVQWRRAQRRASRPR